MFSRRVGWNDGLAAALCQPFAEPASVIGPIGDQPSGRRNERKQRFRPDEVMGLARGGDESNGPPDIVGYGVNFGRPSAARSSDSLLEVPPFAPEAERWAFMYVESTDVVLTTPLDPLRT